MVCVKVSSFVYLVTKVWRLNRRITLELLWSDMNYGRTANPLRELNKGDHFVDEAWVCWLRQGRE